MRGPALYLLAGVALGCATVLLFSQTGITNTCPAPSARSVMGLFSPCLDQQDRTREPAVALE